MANNIGTIGTNLSRTIGGTTTITDGSVITAVSGFTDVGFMVFDNNGTMGICTSFTRDEGDNPIYVFRTCSLNTEIDVQNILGQEY
jgi:hypothetical protein